MVHNKSTKKPVTGIVLSGGFSNRFQQLEQSWQDKALLSITKDETLLERIIKNIVEICTEVIVITNNQYQQLLYKKLIEKLPNQIQEIIRVEIDDLNIQCSGPTRGLISAINYVSNQYVIVTPVDIPQLNLGIFSDLLDNLGDNAICVPLWTTGKIEPLIFAFNLTKLQSVIPLLAFNERSRADDLFRLTSSINFLSIESSKNKIAKKTFASINTQYEYEQLIKSMKIVETSLFNTNKSFSFKREMQSEIDLKFYDFLQKTNFLHITKEILDEGLLLSRTLSENNMDYQAAFLLAFILYLADQSNSTQQIASKNKIGKLAIGYFKLEAQKWENIKIKFLALHAYTDAYYISKLINSDDKEKLLSKITQLRQQLQLKEKEHKDFSFSSLVSDKLPKFLQKARLLIQNAEKAFNEKEPKYETNFLWDHSFRVGKIAYYLAIQEGINPFVPTIAAILHDSGKFVLGNYHSDDISEETHSSTIAEKLLEEEGLSKKEIVKVQKTISGLYDEKILCDLNCQIVHDADRLDKLGVFGIANYFTKMTLRGNNLSESVIRSLSRELTYASAAPKTMLTKTGQLLAITRKKQTLDYFNDLLAEIQFYGLGKYYLKDFEINNEHNILLVIPEKCTKCSGKLTINLNTKTGLKCEKLVATYQCNNCDEQYLMEFCLPLFNTKK
ncbi:MAG: HD domain-containing protein [Asgard group archaeon]|nr:HD domain-containing protein [Asgard group archaeon]